MSEDNVKSKDETESPSVAGRWVGHEICHSHHIDRRIELDISCIEQALRGDGFINIPKKDTLIIIVTGSYEGNTGSVVLNYFAEDGMRQECKGCYDGTSIYGKWVEDECHGGFKLLRKDAPESDHERLSEQAMHELICRILNIERKMFQPIDEPYPN